MTEMSNNGKPSAIAAEQPKPANENHTEKLAETAETEKLADATEKTTKRVHNLIILDESGSMFSIYQPALTGVNETLQTIRDAKTAHPEQEHFVTLVTFDTRHYNEIYKNTSAKKAVDITQAQYQPMGGTPLYDAMGRAINDLRSFVKKGDVVLVTVITDGYENASREYSGTAIKALVEEMKKEDWIFTYIGANQDVEAVAASMAINNHLAFESTVASTQAMFRKEKKARMRLWDRLADEDHSICSKESYFEGIEDDEKSKE